MMLTLRERTGLVLIGRDVEQAALRAALDRTASGTPQFVLLTGEPGIGKTSLLREAAASAADEGWTVRWARGYEDEGTAPYWVWRQLLGEEYPVTATTDVPAATGRWDLFEALWGWVRVRSGQRPLLLVVDDLHWVDEPSLRVLLHQLRRAVPGTRLLVLAGARDGRGEAHPPWAALAAPVLADPATTVIGLEALGPEDSAAFLRTVAADEPSPEACGSAYRLTGGNPLYLREVGAALGRSSPAMPPTLAAAILTRVRRVSPAAQELLRAAAVLGESVDLAVVAGVLDLPAAAVLPQVDELLQVGLLGYAGEPGAIGFAHALVRLAVEGELSLTERVQLHRRAAVTIERTYADDLRPRLADLARHWAAVAVTGESEPAAVWAARAAEHAMTALAFEDAARSWLAASRFATHLPVAERLRWRLRAARAYAAADLLDLAHAECRGVVEEARHRDGGPDTELIADAALALDVIGDRSWDGDVEAWCVQALAGLPAEDRSRRARLSARRVECLMYAGAGDLALPLSQEAVEIAAEAGDEAAEIAALRARQLACCGPEFVELRTELAARMIDLGVRREDAWAELWGRLWRIDTHWDRGRLDLIGAELPAIDRGAERLGSRIARWHALIVRGALAQAQGRFADAHAAGSEAFGVAREIDHGGGFGGYMALLGVLGHHVGYDPITFTTPPQIAEQDEVRSHVFPYLGPARALADSGRIEEARVLYRRVGPPTGWRLQPMFRTPLLALGIAVTRALGEREDLRFLVEELGRNPGGHVVSGGGTANYMGPVDLWLGQGYAGLGDPVAAERFLRSAQETSARTGAVGFEVEAAAELAELLAGLDRRTEARTVAAPALDAARRLGMAPWLERLEAVLAGADPKPVSPREWEVACLVAEGLSNRQIAERLVLSERTAQNHVQNLLTRLGFNKRSQIAAWVASGAGRG